MTTETMEKPERVALNGVDVPTLVATLGVVDENRELAKFTFRADGRWLSGTHSQVRIADFFGAGAAQARPVPHVLDGDHPTVLCGTDNGPTPVELLLAALSACITAGIGNIAAMRQVKLEAAETTVEGDIDFQGIFGMDETVRNGFGGIRATFRIKGDAPADVLEKIVAQSVARSAVFDVLSNGVPVSITSEVA